MVYGRDDLVGVEGRVYRHLLQAWSDHGLRCFVTWNLLIERYQYSTEFEERISGDRKLDIIPQHNHNTVPLCDTEVLETVG